MRSVSPPREHVGFFENFSGQSVLGVFQSGGAQVELVVDLERINNAAVNSFRINFGDSWVLALVNVFVPNRNAQTRTHLSNTARSPQRTQRGHKSSSPSYPL